MATLTVTQTTDYRNQTLDPNITLIDFNLPPFSSNTFATFDGAQFGPGLIANNVTINFGNPTAEAVIVRMSAAGSFSAALWTFVDWASNDVVSLVGTSGNDTITGSSIDDQLHYEGGVDSFDAGTGDDIITVNVSGGVGTSSFNGGADTDQLHISQGVTTSFTSATLTGIEELLVFGGVSATFRGDQIGTGKISKIKNFSFGNGPEALVVRGSDVDLSGVTFQSWTSADTITIQGLSSASNTLFGSDQNETITGNTSAINNFFGHGGADIMSGGNQNDTFRFNADDIVTGESISGGGGTLDTLLLLTTGNYEFGAATVSGVEVLTFSQTGFANARFDATQVGNGAGKIATINAGAGSDRLFVFGANANLLNVTFNNWSSNDSITIAGASGDDSIFGSDQNETILDSGGLDTVNAGGGDDTFFFSQLSAIASGSSFAGGTGTDTLELTGNRIYDFSAATLSSIEKLQFSNQVGNPSVRVTFNGTQLGAGLIATVNGNSLSDRLTVNGSAVNLSAVTFNNWSSNDEIRINGTGNPDVLRGSQKDDIISGFGGNDTLDGGGGNDTADYSGATLAVVVDLPGHIALGTQIGTDTLSSMENVKTGSGNDAVAGDGATNVLDGGAGIDTVSYYAVSSGVILDLAAQVGVDGTSTDTLLNFENANGTRFNDAISGTAAANVLNGLGGIDTISYYLAAQGVVIDLAGNVAIQGGITDTILNFENATGSRYNDAISGNAAANVLNGLGGIDTITYYASAQGVTINLATGTGVSGGVTDSLLNFENASGSAYADNITGNGGTNVLNGLGGTDTLTGGGGPDTFVFRTGQANGDVITDFTGNGAAAGDTISLVGFGTTAQGATFTQVNATQWQIHSGLDGHNEIVTLSNAAAVHGSDFFFV